MREKNVFEYAESMSNEKIMTFYDVVTTLLKDIDCIVCRESAADLLEYTTWGFIKRIHIYTTKKIELPYLECHVVNNLSNIPFIDFDGVKVSPIEIAITDMLKSENTDPQVLYETFANYYFSNNESYDKLIIPNTLKKKANHYMEEGKLFYES